jgi:addiction module RelE/StbE family toxin
VAFRVVWTKPAREDLREILNRIKMDAPEAAWRFGQQVQDAGRSLRKFPERGRQVPEVAGYREMLLGNYRLIYQVQDKTVRIVRFIWGSRDFPRAWRGDR